MHKAIHKLNFKFNVVAKYLNKKCIYSFINLFPTCKTLITNFKAYIVHVKKKSFKRLSAHNLDIPPQNKV